MQQQIGHANAPVSVLTPLDVQVEEGCFSDVEIRVQEGMVIKSDRQLVSRQAAEQRKFDLQEYASRFTNTPIKLAPLLGVRIDREPGGYRVRHAVEYVQGHSVQSLGNESPVARRLMANEVVAAVLRMPSMPYNRDHMPVGLDILERNIQVAGMRSNMPGQLVLVDMTPPILRYNDGSLNVTDNVNFWDKYFATKSGAIARYLAHAFWPIPVNPQTHGFDVRRFVNGLSDIVPSEWREPVIVAMESYATEALDRLGAVACAATLPPAIVARHK